MLNARKWGLALAPVALVAIAGVAMLGSPGARTKSMADGGRSNGLASFAAALGLGGTAAQSTPAGPAHAAAASDADSQGTYIVVFREPALGTYQGEVAGLPAPKRRADARGKVRLDVKGAQARNYVAYLRGRQAEHETKLARVAGRALGIRSRMQHAVNGFVADLTAAEAAQIQSLPEVMLVEAYREYPLLTDLGPRLIGAEPVWDGTNTGAPAAYQGEGIVFGIIDSGINFESPSFAAVDPLDGYAHVNPLGTGSYLGTCAPGQVDAGRCNNKLIGGYDFVCGAPGNQCGLTNIREEPGFGDTSGHGTHTASTAGGNRRDADFRGAPRRISGVAPRANIVAFDVCYTNTSTGQGLCPNVSAVAAIEQAIVDGVVDVFNYSIGGGSQPWSESVSLAFLNATNAGIYVAASAGNSGPGPNTLSHNEPWVASTAASQHGRANFSLLFQVTGPSPVPSSLTAIVIDEGLNGVAHTATLSAPLKVSAGIDSTDDGCVAYAAGHFTGTIAMIRRGTCSFAIKANNASAAGAVAVIIANNAAGTVAPSVPGTTVPVFGMQQADANAVRDFAIANPSATVQVGFPAVAVPNTVDALASFSSRGPAGTFSLIKPDIAAPGVNILAAYAGTTITGHANLVSAINGTSMASPHQAGAAGLIRQARPTWTVPEIKSALMMTAVTEMFLEDQVTPANAFARGSGRVRVDRAINAGLVMHETGANYLAANPATGGNPSMLNQPSMANRSCFESCTFTRQFRNTLSSSQNWTARVEGLKATVSPNLVAAAPGQVVTVTVTVDSKAIAPNGTFEFGQLVLDPTGGGQLPTLRLPIGVAVQPPVVTVPAVVSASAFTIMPSRSTSTTIGNVGGSTLAYSVDNTGTALVPVYAGFKGAVTSGFRSVVYTDPTTAAAQAAFAADDFVLAAETQITSLSTEAFTVSTFNIANYSSVTWSIYPDVGGNPAGNPHNASGAAVWTYTAAPTSAGASMTATGISLNLLTAGQNVVLPPGRYWMVTNVRSSFANRWAWYGSADGDGSFRTMTIATDGSGAWVNTTSFAGLAMKVDGRVTCGAPWMGAFTPGSGNVAPGSNQPVTVRVNAAGLAKGNYLGYYCVSSNDPQTPKIAGRLALSVK
jgi:hypothetical protein